MVDRYSVKPGMCTGDSTRCKLSGRDCDGVWQSGVQLLGSRFSCPMHQTLLDMTMGRCGDDGAICAPNPESCAEMGMSYLGPESFRTAFSDASIGDECRVETTKFGSCNNECRFAPEDCPLGSVWTFPDDNCTCDRVQVGACQNKDHEDVISCAVNKEACDEQSNWISLDDLRTVAGIDCYICRAKSTAPLAEDVLQEQEMTSKDTPQDATSMDNDRNGNPLSSSSSSGGGGNNNNEVTILVASLCGTVVLMVAGFLLWMVQRKRQAEASAKSKRSASEAKTVPHIIVDPSKMEYGEESDDVSVL